MRVLIVYESLFGNTREIAEAIGAGVREADPAGQVDCMQAAETQPSLIQEADVLIVGGPTHMRGMTSGFSRKMGLQAERKEATKEGRGFEPEPHAEGPGVRDWLHELPEGDGRHAAAFDTRAGARLAGGAADGIARRLRRHGYRLVAEPAGFLIEDTEGPLQDGERDRAKTWGSGLLQQAAR
jgi:flavodoxin